MKHPYYRGYDAYGTRQPIRANPFAYGTQKYGQWRGGWLQACADRRQDEKEGIIISDESGLIAEFS